MNDRRKFGMAVAMMGLLLMALLVLLTGCEEPSVRAVRERISIESKDDCYIKNGSDLILYSNDLLSETLHLYGDSGNLYSSGIITATTLVTSYTNMDASGTLNVDGASTLNSTLDVDGATTLNSTLDVDGNITSGTGAITMTDSVNITGTVDCDSTLNVDGTSTLVGQTDVTGKLYANGGLYATSAISSSGSVNVDTTLTVDGASTLTGDVGAGADVVIALFERDTAQTTLVCTNGCTITATGTYQPISSAADVGFSALTVLTAGDRLELHNIGAYTITVTDTGTTMLSGNAVLGPYDNLSLRCDGTNWIETAQADN